MSTSWRDRPWLSACALAGTLAALAGPAVAHQGVDPALLQQILPGLAPPGETEAQRIERGRRLFLEETFGGNGRTCATCHPPSNNFTIDAAFIATLPARDALFVAELDPKLGELEKPALMRQLGLILENVDGFDNPGVMRGVPHTLGLSTSVTPHRPTNGDLVGATGWSGDGAPGDGSLRNFAIGAVVQHFTRTLQRRPGVDFRLPNAAELDAIEAFQRSLGRQEELDLPDGLSFSDALAEEGKTLFLGQLPTRGDPPGSRSCAFCHAKAGANASAGPGAGKNQQFDTGVARLPNAPACFDPSVPGDGGFAAGPDNPVARNDVCGSGTGSITFRGTGLFNTPSLVEAADTPPFFHNNSAETLEDAILFYASDTFHASPSRPAFAFEDGQVLRLSAFLRAINALDNIRQATVYIDRALQVPIGIAKQTALLAIADISDAIEVLRDGPEDLFTSPDATQPLEAARSKLTQFQSGVDVTLLGQAKADLESARGRIIIE
jgi:cytochrome c peroxidase